MERLPVKLILGLGNPGRKYEGTRHNAGFLVLDELASRAGVLFGRGWFSSARMAKAELAEVSVLLAKPTTFMNRSGEAAAALMRKRGLKAADLVVVFDDLELGLGQVRVRPRGGAGGHKGLQSLIAHLGTEDFVRVRVGVGPRPAGSDLVDYVLSRFPAGERPRVTAAVKRAADAVERLLAVGVDKTMNEFNKKQGEGDDT